MCVCWSRFGEVGNQQAMAIEQNGDLVPAVGEPCKDRAGVEGLVVFLAEANLLADDPQRRVGLVAQVRMPGQKFLSERPFTVLPAVGHLNRELAGKAATGFGGGLFQQRQGMPKRLGGGSLGHERLPG